MCVCVCAWRSTLSCPQCVQACSSDVCSFRRQPAPAEHGASLTCCEAFRIVWQESALLIGRHYAVARFEMAAPAGRSALRAAVAEGAAPADPAWLQERIARPLGKVALNASSRKQMCIVSWRVAVTGGALPADLAFAATAYRAAAG